MIELNQLTVLIMVEIMLGLVIICGVLGYFALARKGRIRKAAHHLAERVQSDKPARTERLKTLLIEKYGYSGNELEQALHTLTQAEMRLFQNLINGYMKDDQIHLQQVDVDEENLVLAYQTLEPKVETVAAAPTPAGEGDQEELERLQDENQRLTEELRVTMDTMGRMLNEYSSMFAGGADKPATREAPEKKPVAPRSSSPDETSSEEGIGVEIPDLQASDLVAESELSDSDAMLDGGAEAASALDEEVSEIIDEVMDMTDEHPPKEEAKPVSQEQASDIGESLLDELEEVHIELPENAGDGAVEDAGKASDPDSLEDEWARLLEEDARSKSQSDDK